MMLGRNWVVAHLAASMIAVGVVHAAAADQAARISDGKYSHWMLTNGPLSGRVAWAFDNPDEESDPKGLLLSHLRRAAGIEWASYKPTHPEIVEALKNHPNVSGFYDQNYCGGKCAAAFEGYGRVKPVTLGVYKSKSKRKWFVMHHKFAVLRARDGDGVITGSFNWNKSAAELNFENLIFIKSKKLADAYSQVFNKLPAEESLTAVDADVSAGFGAAGMELINQQIDAAQKSIRVAVWSMNVASKKNPNPVYDALVAAMERGVDVQVLTDYHKAKKRKHRKLKVHSIRMASKKAHMHHKFLVIDEATVVSGSFNFVTKSFSGNHENVVVVRSPAMAASFTKHWLTNEITS